MMIILMRLLNFDFHIPHCADTDSDDIHSTIHKSERNKPKHLPVAQLDRARDSDSRGRRFESCRAGHKRTKTKMSEPSVCITEYSISDITQMISVWNEVVSDGMAFPQEDFLTEKSGASFFASQT